MTVVALGPIDITDALAALPDLEDAWPEGRWRAEMPFSPHKDSDTIYLRRQPGARPRDVLHQLASVATRFYTIAPLALLVERVCSMVDGRPARAMLIRLPPGGVVLRHADEGIYAQATERYHLALMTNPRAWLEVDGEKYHLPAGVLCAMDKHVPHSAANEGDTDRIHCVVDVMPEAGEVLA